MELLVLDVLDDVIADDHIKRVRFERQPFVRDELEGIAFVGSSLIHNVDTDYFAGMFSKIPGHIAGACPDLKYLCLGKVCFWRQDSYYFIGFALPGAYIQNGVRALG